MQEDFELSSKPDYTPGTRLAAVNLLADNGQPHSVVISPAGENAESLGKFGRYPLTRANECALAVSLLRHPLSESAQPSVTVSFDDSTNVDMPMHQITAGRSLTSNQGFFLTRTTRSCVFHRITLQESIDTPQVLISTLANFGHVKTGDKRLADVAASPFAHAEALAVNNVGHVYRLHLSPTG